MEDRYTPTISEEERAARRAQRAAAREKKRRAKRRRQLVLLAPVAVLILAAVGLATAWAHREPEPQEELPEVQPMAFAEEEPEPDPEPLWTPEETADTIHLDDTFPSAYAVVVDRADGVILAEKSSDTVISPASMTKILTLLVAAERVADLDDTFTMTIEITDYCYVNKCSVVGFEVGEVATIRELLDGTILPSGADAALALATYVAGSHEAFVELMNEKLEELGLSDTAHFTNCVGLYDPDHHCTVRDMAVILNAAMDNELCRKVLNARIYETAPTEQHPEGQILSNWFLRRIEDKDTGTIDVIGAKTGYVVQSGNCAASCGRAENGEEYICVTGNAYSSWRAIYDHVDLYKTYCN